MTTVLYVDLEAGNDSNDGSTFALRKKSIASASTGLTGGDEIRVMASPAITSLGQAATWTDGSDTVTLSSAVTKTIDNCETAWTAAANVTVTRTSSYYRQGSYGMQAVFGSAFTTGKAAYYPLGSAQDFSAYQRISFWIYTGAILAAGVLQIKLCSDTAGNTPVNSIDIPALTATSGWRAFTVDTGGALGSSIQSVALYAASDPGTPTIRLDNIIACKVAGDDALTLNSLISKNSGVDEPWFAINSIDGTTIKLGFKSKPTTASCGCKYFGTTETVTTYKREPILLSTNEDVLVGGVSYDSMLTISGGWDRTSMTSQTDLTWLRSENSYCIFPGTTVNRPFIKFDSFGVVSPIYSGIYGSFQTLYVSNIHAASCNYAIATYQAYRLKAVRLGHFTGCEAPVYCDSWSLQLQHTPVEVEYKKCFGYSSSNTGGSSGFVSDSNFLVGVRLKADEIRNVEDVLYINPSYSAYFEVIGAVISNYYLLLQANRNSKLVFRNCDAKSGVYSSRGIVIYDKYAKTAGDYRTYMADGSCIQTATDQRHTESGYSWKFTPVTAPTNNDGWSSLFPLTQTIAKIACAANEQRTVSLWFRRSNSGLSMRLRCKGGQLAGIASDVTSSMTAAADTWEQLTIQFTPTETGVVEINADTWGGTTYSGWIDDMSIL